MTETTPHPPAAAEYVILVDADDRPTGTAEKLEAHRLGVLHRAFSVLIWDSAGRMLLQQRAADKYHSGSLWTNTCCGHPRPGEDVAAAAQRRLAEEMGFSTPLAALGTIQYRAAFDNGLTEHEVVHVFRGLHDGPVNPDPREAESYDWRTLHDIRRDIARAPERYSFWFREYVNAKWPTVLAEARG